MKVNHIRLGIVLLLHPGYKLIASSFCDISSLKGCTVKKIKTDDKSYKQEFCVSDNGNKVYKIPIYARLASNKKVKYVKCYTETYKEANDIFQLVLTKKRIPIDIEKRK